MLWLTTFAARRLDQVGAGGSQVLEIFSLRWPARAATGCRTVMAVQNRRTADLGLCSASLPRNDPPRLSLHLCVAVLLGVR